VTLPTDADAAAYSPPRLPTPIEFDTERLRLRCWQERHIAPFAALNADPQVMRYFPATVSEEQTRAGVEVWRAQFAESGWSNWAVELKATGEFIGFIGLSVPRRQLPFSPCVEIGWRLARAHWSCGYASEGARACVALGFERLGLDDIVSFTALTNLPSRAVMERVGMFNTGQDFDHPAVPEVSPLRRHCLYALSVEQWRANQRAAAGGS
jgi:RimJ/RimL family protein N-acetyltransferase